MEELPLDIINCIVQYLDFRDHVTMMSTSKFFLSLCSKYFFDSQSDMKKTDFWQIKDLTEAALIRLLTNAATPTPGLQSTLSCLNLIEIPAHLLTYKVLRVIYQQFSSMSTLTELHCNLLDCKNFMYYCSSMFPRLTRLTATNCNNHSLLLDTLGQCTKLHYLSLDLKEEEEPKFWKALTSHTAAMNVFMNLNTLLVRSNVMDSGFSTVQMLVTKAECKVKNFAYRSEKPAYPAPSVMFNFVQSLLKRNFESLEISLPHYRCPTYMPIGDVQDITVEPIAITSPIALTRLELNFPNVDIAPMGSMLTHWLSNASGVTQLKLGMSNALSILCELSYYSLSHLYLSGAAFSTYENKSWKFPRLRRLTLDNINIQESRLMELLDSLPTITYLTLDKVTVGTVEAVSELTMSEITHSISRLELLETKMSRLQFLLMMLYKSRNSLSIATFKNCICPWNGKVEKEIMNKFQQATMHYFTTIKDDDTSRVIDILRHLNCPSIGCIDFGTASVNAKALHHKLHYFPKNVRLIASQFENVDSSMLKQLHEQHLHCNRLAFSERTTHEDLIEAPKELMENVIYLNLLSFKIVDLELFRSFLKLCKNLRTLKIVISPACSYEGLLDAILEFCPTLEFLILGGKGTVSVQRFTNFIQSLKNLRLLVTDCCPYNSLEEIEQVKTVCRSSGRPAPKLMLSFTTKRSVMQAQKEYEQQNKCIVQ